MTVPLFCRMKTKLVTRWRFGEVRTHGPSKKDVRNDWVPKSLLDFLGEKISHERSEHAPPATLDENDTQTTFVESCHQLKGFIDDERATASFACGGAIPVAPTGSSQPENSQVSAPVNLYWSTRNELNTRKLVLPVNSPEALRQLVADGDPASLGRGDRDVVDPEYRRAVKIDPDHFATSFHPTDHGIIENIEQVLLPSISDEHDNKLQFRKFHAEPCKLNVSR